MCLIFVSNSALAADNSTINFSATITTKDNQALNGSYNFRFSLYETTSKGDPVWRETWLGFHKVKIEDGIFRVKLGAIENLTDIDFSTRTYYLKIEFDPDNNGIFDEPFEQRIPIYNQAAADSTSSTNSTSQSNLGDQLAASGNVTIAGNWTFENTLNVSGLDIADLSGILKASDGLVSGNATTTDLTEGNNLYFTEERVDDRVAGLLQDSDSISWSYDDGSGTLIGTVSNVQSSLSGGDGIAISSNVVSVDYNTANLKISSGQLNTIQDISTTANPQFAGAILTGTVQIKSANPLRFYDGDSSNFVGFKAPSAVSSNITWTLPSTDGTAGQVLITDGSGLLDWTDNGSGGGGASTSATYITVSSESGLSAERILTGTSNQITITDNGAGGTIVVSTPQNIHTGASPTFAGLTLSDLTASRILSTNGSKGLTSTSLASWLTGTSNQITVTDDGDGTVTVALPQSIATSSNPTFSTLNLSGTSNQIVMQSAGVTGTLTWTPTSTGKSIILPDASGTVAVSASGALSLSAAGALTITDAAADGSTKGAASFTAADFDASSGNIAIDYTNGQAASSGAKGFLTAADWTTFNAKQAAGNYITALTGDVTASGPGSVAATIANGAVSLAKMADMATASFIGRNTAATGAPEVLSASTAKSILAIAQADVSGLTTASSPTFSTLNLSGTSNQIVMQSAGVTGTLTWTPTSTGKSIILPDASGTVAVSASGALSLSAAGALTITDAAADGSTKGAASFTAADFDASSGNIAIDYTNGQAASSGAKGFLTAADWTTFNAKQAAGSYITTLTLAGTSGDNQTISAGDTITIAAGTDITTTGGATDTVTIANSSTLATVTGRGATTTTLINLDGGIAVDTSNFTVDGTSGAVVTASTLQVASTANLNGGIAIDTDNFTVSGTTGATAIAGAMTTGTTLDISYDSATSTGALVGLDLDFGNITPDGTNTVTGLSIQDPAANNGSTQYGIQFAGTNWDAGIVFDESTTVAQGIQWGTDANSVNLYRSADDTLKTDDTFIANAIGIGTTPLTGNPFRIDKTISVADQATTPLSFRGSYTAETAGYDALGIYVDATLNSQRSTYGLMLGPNHVITDTNTAYGAAIGNTGSSTVTVGSGTGNLVGLSIRQPLSITGTLATNIGLLINAVSTGTSTIGLKIADAGTYSLQLASTDGDAASGITFGTDTNLYRSTTDTLKTDDALIVGGALNVTGTTTIATALSGMIKATSGVLSIASAGTDYLATGGTLLTLAGTSGDNQTISQGNTLTIAAGTDITTTGGATDTVTIANSSTLATVTGRGATTTTLVNLNGGIAVDTSNFTVDGTSGAVVTASTLQVASTANLNGGIAVDTSNFTVSGTTGATAIAAVNAAGGSLNALALSGTLGIFDGTDTFRGIYLNYTNANHTSTSNNFYGIDIAGITADADATERAVNIGAGWDVGAYIADGATYALQLASTDGDAASGITFGTDTTLYRSAANNLKTDDQFIAANGLVSINGNTDLIADSAVVDNLPVGSAGGQRSRLLGTGSDTSTNGNLALATSRSDASNYYEPLRITGSTLAVSFDVATSASAALILGTDANLYRSTTDTLKTDDSFIVGANLNVTGTTTIATALSGMLKATSGVISAATSDVDFQQAVTWGDGLEYAAGTAAVDYNTTNLKITSTELNTIQDIATASTPQFARLGLGAAANASYLLDGSVTFTNQSGVNIGNNLATTFSPAGALSGATTIYGYNSTATFDSTQEATTTAGSISAYNGIAQTAGTASGNLKYLYGQSLAAKHFGTGTLQNLYGFSSYIFNDDASSENGDVTNSYNYFASSYTDKTVGTVGSRYGLYVEDTTGGGNMTNQYGAYIAAQTAAATTNVGIYIADAGTYSLQLASTDGDAASGITFGTDTNLYRSTADTLKTDDKFIAAAGITASTLTSGRITYAGTSGVLQDTANMTYGATYGLTLAAGSTSGLQLSSTTGTAVGGLLFGTDTNLYRSAANTIATDDSIYLTTAASSRISLGVTPLANIGVYLQPTYSGGGNIYGIANQPTISADATTYSGTYFEATVPVSVTLGTYYGMKVRDVINNGTVTTNYGIYIEDIDSGTNNYAMNFVGTSGLARQGIWWNADTNLYRSAADTLKTDDIFQSKALVPSGTAVAQHNSAWSSNIYTLPNASYIDWQSDGTYYRGFGADTAKFSWKSSNDVPSVIELMTLGTSGTNIGRLSVPTTGVNAGLLLGGDAQIYRGAADELSIAAGDTLTFGSSGAAKASATTTFKSYVTDTGTGSAFIFDTSAAVSTVSLFAVKENGTLRFNIDKDGVVQAPVVYSTTVTSARDVQIDSTGKLGYVVSSRRFKQDIAELTSSDWVYDLQPVSYKYISDPTYKQVGLIAEDVQPIAEANLHDLVSYNPKNPSQVDTVNYSQLIVPILSATQKLNTRLTQAELDVASLQTKLNSYLTDGTLTINNITNVAGDITITPASGQVTVKGNLNVEQAIAGASIDLNDENAGRIVMPADSTEVFVPTTSVKANDKVLLTPVYSTNGALNHEFTLFRGDIKEEEGFTIHVIPAIPLGGDLEIDWLIVK